MKSHLIFFEKEKEMSSAAVVISTLRVKFISDKEVYFSYSATKINVVGIH